MHNPNGDITIGDYTIDRSTINSTRKISVKVPIRILGKDDRDAVDKTIRGLEIGTSILEIFGALATGNMDGGNSSVSHQKASDNGETRKLRNSQTQFQSLTVTVINYNLFNSIYIYNDRKQFNYLKEALECGKRVYKGETNAISDYAEKCREMYDNSRYGVYPDDVQFMHAVLNNENYTYFEGSWNELDALLTKKNFGSLQELREAEKLRLEEEKRRKEEEKRKIEEEKIKKLKERENKLKHLSEKYSFNMDQDIEVFIKEISDHDYKTIELTRVNITEELNYWKNQSMDRSDEKSKQDYLVALYQAKLEKISYYINIKMEQDIRAINARQASEYLLFEQSLAGKTSEQLADIENDLKTRFDAWKNRKHDEPKRISQCEIEFYMRKSELLKDYINKAREKEKALRVRLYGKKGEENVEYAIKWLPKEYKSIERDCRNDIGGECILILNKDFINEAQEMDHIVVGPQGVFIIETKYYSGKLTIDNYGNWYRIKEGKDKTAERNPIQQVDRHHLLLGSILEDIPIFDVICFAHPDLIIEGIENCAVDIVKSDLLGRYILSKESQKNYNSNEIEDIVARINKYKCSNN